MLQPDTNLETLYTYKNKCKNFFYYQCNKRPKCLGKTKFKKKTNEFIITEICKNKAIHNKLTYKFFSKLMEGKNYKLD